jgi:4-amino-4-deoxy-L-arabinose transferase-like glycosyltransferase
MKKLTESTGILPFYLFAAGVFLVIISKDVLANGMFLDGVIYSDVSKNLAHGLGSFWNPYFTATFMSDFHEHPPLAFGIQSLLFRLLGDSRFVERFYSLLTFCLTALVIHKIWKKLGYKNSWIPLFLWALTPTVFWTSYNNLLENTLTVFTALSVYFYLRYLEKDSFAYIMLSALMLSLGFLTKGFVSFFPWTFPLIYHLFQRQKSTGKMLLNSISLVFFTILPLLLLILLSPTILTSLEKYIDNQVINSIKNVVTVNSRFDIVKRLFSELAPAALICLTLVLIFRFKKNPVRIERTYRLRSLAFIAFGLTGVLPIMISMKQSGFYILPVYPFFLISAAVLIYPVTTSMMDRINFEGQGYRIFRLLALALFLTGIILSVVYSRGYSRDKDMIEDTCKVLTVVPSETIININPELFENWSLQAYYARFKDVSLDPELRNQRDYLLISNESYSDTLNRGYSRVLIDLKDYQLFKRKVQN